MAKSKETGELIKEIEKLKKINKALVDRVKKSVDSQGNAFSLFEGNILLQKEISQKTQELEKAKIELLKQKQSLDEAVAILEMDANGVITEVNDNFCKIIQYSREELVGKTHKDAIEGNLEVKKTWKRIWKVIKQKQVFRGEILNQNKKGEIFWIESTVFPVLDENNEIKGYVKVAIDITEKKQNQKQLLHNAKLASIGEIAAGVGHEINNPLAINVGNISAMKKAILSEAFNKSDVLSRIERIEDANDRIRKIVDGLRTYARFDREFNDVININEAIKSTIDLVREIYDKDGVNIKYEGFDEVFYTYGSSGKLQQVVMNLLSNAKDATEGQEERDILISMKKIGEDQVQLSVKDNGHGIPDNLKEKILNPFFTTKEIGKGTGMGLGVVNEIVESMKGELSIQSKEGQGSVFSVVLPVAQSDEVKKITERTDLSDVKLSGHALVVDDEEGIRLLLTELLKDFGLSVDSADDGDTALELVKKKNYDYICTDMKMSRVQGDEFIREARKLANGNTKYFIITGGVATTYDKKRRDELWKIADGYIKKPFDSDSILRELSKK